MGVLSYPAEEVQGIFGLADFPGGTEVFPGGDARVTIPPDILCA